MDPGLAFRGEVTIIKGDGVELSTTARVIQYQLYCYT
jgi:hypothetical protein